MTDRPTKGIDALWDDLWEDVRYNVTGRPSGPIRIARHQAAIEAEARAALIDELVAAVKEHQHSIEGEWDDWWETCSCGEWQDGSFSDHLLQVLEGARHGK